MGRTNEKKNVGGDISIGYKVITKSFTRQIIARYSLKKNVNQQKKNPLLTMEAYIISKYNFGLGLR